MYITVKCLNPLKTRKSFRHKNACNDQTSSLLSLNPLKTRKSFRHIELTATDEDNITGLNPLKTRKSFRQKFKRKWKIKLPF